MKTSLLLNLLKISYVVCFMLVGFLLFDQMFVKHTVVLTETVFICILLVFNFWSIFFREKLLEDLKSVEPK